MHPLKIRRAARKASIWMARRHASLGGGGGGGAEDDGAGGSAGGGGGGGYYLGGAATFRFRSRLVIALSAAATAAFHSPLVSSARSHETLAAEMCI